MSTKFSTMYLVSNTYVEDCETQRQLLTQDTAMVDQANLSNNPTQSVRDPTTVNQPPPAVNPEAPVANQTPMNTDNPGLECTNILNNNRVCGQRFDDEDQLFAHQLNAHNVPEHHGPVASTPRRNITMADTVINASIRADRNAASDPVVDVGGRKCTLCSFIATSANQLDRHFEQKHMNGPVNAHVLTGSNASGGNELKDLVESYRNDDEEVPSGNTSTPNIRRRLRGGETRVSGLIAKENAEKKAKQEKIAARKKKFNQNKSKREREQALREAMRQGMEDQVNAEREQALREAMRQGLENQANMSGVEEGVDRTPLVSKRKSKQAKVATRAVKSSVNPSKKFIVARKKRNYRKKKAAVAKKSRQRPRSAIDTYKQRSKLAAAEARIANLKKKIRNKRKRLLKKKQPQNENYRALGLEGYE